MWGRQAHHIELTPADREVLERIVRNGRSEQRIARRGRILLAMPHPESLVDDVADALGIARSIVWRVCRRYGDEERGLEGLHDAQRGGRPRQFSPLVRVQIEQLACCELLGVGLRVNLTHWSTRRLAQVAIQRGIVPQIAHSSVALILKQADLQPHRYIYWKTPTLNTDFVVRASRILGCYESVVL